MEDSGLGEKLVNAEIREDAEMKLLGALLTTPNALDRCVRTLDETDFDLTKHILIFHTIKKLYARNCVVDVHTVLKDLQNSGKLKASGGAEYITMLAQRIGKESEEKYFDILLSDRRERCFQAQFGDGYKYYYRKSKPKKKSL